jgi:hypothetical protein
LEANNEYLPKSPSECRTYFELFLHGHLEPTDQADDHNHDSYLCGTIEYSDAQPSCGAVAGLVILTVP